MPEITGTPTVEILSRRALHSGFYSMELLTVRQRRFDGSWIGPFEREVVIPPAAAIAVLPYDPVADLVVLIEQVRIAAMVAGTTPLQVEIVAGMVEPGESLEAVAARELQEEAGLSAKALCPIVKTLPNPGANAARMHIWLALVEAAAAGGSFGLAEEQEDIRATALPFAEAFALLEGGRIENGPTVTALYWLALNRPRLRAEAGLPAVAPAG